MSDSEFKRTEDFTSLYANNIQFESSSWDLKVIFGQLDQSKQPLVVDQHTAMTMAWPHAKIAAYFLTINVIIHQSQNGLIHVPVSVIPPRPDASDQGLDEAGKRAITYLAWIHDQFFGANPYIPEGVGAPVSTDAPPASD